MEDSKCPRCEGEMAPGRLSEQYYVNFKPDGVHTPYFKLSSETGKLAIEALMCLDCGYIELRGHVKRLRELLNR